MHQKNTALPAAMPVSFTLNGETVVGRADQTLLQTADAARRRDPAPLLHGGHAGRRQLPHLHGRDQGRARAGAVLLPLSQGRDGGHDQQRARAHQPEDVDRAAAVGRSRDGLHARLRARSLGEEAVDRQAALRGAAAAGRRPLASGDGRAPRRLHPVQALRARLPRRAGQRRHRLRLPRRPVEDRLRPRRSDGRLHLRRLRRVRAGVPDRRADAGARRRQGRARQAGGFGVPVLRRRLPAHLQRQGQHDPVRAGQGRPGELEPPVREGPLRLRLRAAPASADQAAHPQARRAEAQGLRRSIPRTGTRSSARRRGKRRSTSRRRGCATSATPTASARSPASARPRARTKRPISSRSWCAPASARTTSTTARACATRRASPR